VAGYQVLGMLGRGGMGVVYKARHLRLGRLVALKMVLGGAHAGPQQLARFHLEAEALASLQHPHIVQVYETGEHDHSPYLALEFVDGPSLDQKLDDRPLAALPAAQLVQMLARAMHCAHQRGVVHRDLKPANVLLAPMASGEEGTGVDGLGVPKVTDFGLAKQMHGAPGATPGYPTQTGEVMGTPSYMAPEQATGNTREAGPLADVYALGAILYTLLTGQPPFQAASSFETIQQVIAREPVAPGRLQPKIPRDLETICLKCLHKDPRRRYPSALDLAEDLRRFLDGEPILARPVGAWERLRKWARRRPAVAALIALTALAIVGLPAGLAWHNLRLSAERDYAKRNYQRAKKAVEQMLTEIADDPSEGGGVVGDASLAYEPRMEEKRRKLLAKALQFYREFLEEKPSDPAMRKETGLAYKRMGDILRLLGQYDRAQQAYGEAITLLGQLAEEAPSEAEYQKELAYCYNFLGEVFRVTSRPREAAPAYQRALELQQELVSNNAGQPAYQLDLARTHYNLGILFREDNHPEDAEPEFAEAIRLLEKLVWDHRDPRYRQHLARAYLNVGPVLVKTRRPEEARTRYKKAIDILEELANDDRLNPHYRHEQGVCYLNLGNLLLDISDTHSTEEQAKKAYAKAHGLFQQLATDFPKVPIYQQELANLHISLGRFFVSRQWSRRPSHVLAAVVLNDQPLPLAMCSSYFLALSAGDMPAGKNAWEQARDTLEKLASEHQSVPALQADLGMTCGNLGWLWTQQKNWKAAQSELQRAVTCLKSALKPPNAQNPYYLEALRKNYQTLTETHLQLGQHEAAAETAAALPEVFHDRGVDYYYAACFTARCVPLTDQPARRERYTDQAIELLGKAAARGVAGHQRLLDLEEKILTPLRPAEVTRLLARIGGQG
jgi:tetratricopeptide (TPR) repeat protein